MRPAGQMSPGQAQAQRMQQQHQARQAQGFGWLMSRRKRQQEADANDTLPPPPEEDALEYPGEGANLGEGVGSKVVGIILLAVFAVIVVSSVRGRRDTSPQGVLPPPYRGQPLTNREERSIGAQFGPVQWHRMVSVGPGTGQVVVHWPDSRADIDVFVYDAMARQLVASNVVGAGETVVRWTVRPNTPYDVMVRHNYGPPVPYRFTASVPAG